MGVKSHPTKIKKKSQRLKLKVDVFFPIAFSFALVTLNKHAEGVIHFRLSVAASYVGLTLKLAV
jgi:hypothetical protein